MQTSCDLKQRIRATIGNREKKTIRDPQLTVSAVLIPIYEKAGEYFILFTKRSKSVESHKGEVTFPGGKRDEADENLLATALRESFEEVGLQPEAVEVLGEVDDQITMSTNFIVTSFVGFIPYPYRFEISCNEVEKLVEIPISALRDKANFREEVVSGESFSNYFYYEGEIIWGATARIIKNLLDLVF